MPLRDLDAKRRRERRLRKGLLKALEQVYLAAVMHDNPQFDDPRILIKKALTSISRP